MCLVGVGHKRHVGNRFGDWKKNSNYLCFVFGKLGQVFLSFTLTHIIPICWFTSLTYDTSHLPWDPPLNSLTWATNMSIFSSVTKDLASSSRTPTLSKLEAAVIDILITGSSLSLSCGFQIVLAHHYFISFLLFLMTCPVEFSFSLRQKDYRNCFISSQHCVRSP